jgi:hypothetical protein
MMKNRSKSKTFLEKENKKLLKKNKASTLSRIVLFLYFFSENKSKKNIMMIYERPFKLR